MRQREKELNETPTMSDVIKFAIENRLVDLHTCMPGTIVEYDPTTQKAKVQPQFQRRFRDGQTLPLPAIDNVPVRMPRAGKAFIHLPLKAGDPVTLHFHERSLDTWKQEGGSVDPGTESRKHALSDAYAEVGGYPFNDTVDGDSENILIVNDKAKITIQPNGKYKIENNQEEAFALVSELLDELFKADTNTIYGPMKLNNFAKFQALKARWDKLKG